MSGQSPEGVGTRTALLFSAVVVVVVIILLIAG
jgi:hypothetical protein